MNTMERPPIAPSATGDASLLESLYQLVFDSETDSWEFEQLDTEVYGRLEAAYRSDTAGAQVVLID